MDGTKMGWILGGYHTYEDFGLMMADYHISPPEPIITLITIPGARKPLDLTDALYDEPTCDNRTLEIRCWKEEDPDRYELTKTYLNQTLIGKAMSMVGDHDPFHEWIGRVTSIECDHPEYPLSTYTIICSVEPRKYRTWSPGSDWLWDTFNFKTGVIQNTTSMQITGSMTMTLYPTSSDGIEYDVTPIFRPSVPMAVKIDGVQYVMPANTDTWLKEVVIKAGTTKTIEITGTGTLTITMKGESF